MDGILRVDKPRGVTSHDVVAWVRRSVGQRSVGHAGTLDPMATGLLVVLLGQATKLSAYVTADAKRYIATVRFGIATDTLDADGTVLETSPAGTPSPHRDTLATTLAGMVGVMLQVPPVVSAIKVDGVPMHARTRRGESMELAPREVTLVAADVLTVGDGDCTVDVTVSKGFYVRSLARDLAAALGTVGHLTALRRISSGALSVDGAVTEDILRAATQRDPKACATVVSAVEPIATAAHAMRKLTVSPEAVRELGFGRTVVLPEEDGTVLVLGDTGVPVCVGAFNNGVLSVLRGLRRD